MPFCTQCGRQVRDVDVFCATCGKQQLGNPGASGARGAAQSQPTPQPPPRPPQDPLAGLTPHAASILCYIPTVGWIAAVVVLSSRKFRAEKIVRFHAFQGLYLFAAWLIVQWVVHPAVASMPGNIVRIDRILEGLLMAVSIFMIVKASHGEPYVLPIVGELAQRSASEQ